MVIVIILNLSIVYLRVTAHVLHRLKAYSLLTFFPLTPHSNQKIGFVNKPLLWQIKCYKTNKTMDKNWQIDPASIQR